MTLSDPLQASLLRLSAKGISVFSPHTSLDATPNGINTFLIQPFVGKGLEVSEVVRIVKEHLSLEHGASIGTKET
jgi:putative NIF3 family GTP cyclohydrolase 1 type 2